MNILVIGLGYVGKGAKRMFERRYNVETVDPNGKADYKKIPDKQYDLAVVCVPTESREDGSCDTSVVDYVVRKVNAKGVLIKSTVEPGTTDRLGKKYNHKIVFSPEFMGEGNYHSTYDFHTEMYKTPWIILGGEEEATTYVHDIMLPIVGPEKEWHFLTAKEAELVKYMENTYFAMKVAFANEMYNISQAMDCNWEKVRQAWGADPRVDIMHTAVFPDKRGFDGKCLPKDVNALVSSSLKHKYNPQLIQEVLRTNERITEGRVKKKVRN